MADAKIQLNIGDIQFSGEGDSKWLDVQVEKILKLAGGEQKASPRQTSKGAGGSSAKMGSVNQTLPAFLREKNATTNQTRKFLATGIWIHDVKQKPRLKPGDVAKRWRTRTKAELATLPTRSTRT